MPLHERAVVSDDLPSQSKPGAPLLGGMRLGPYEISASSAPEAWAKCTGPTIRI